jgi:ubiquitin-conjugating enzyme E2 J1
MAAQGAKYNVRNPSVKRILQEMKEFQKDDSPELTAEALEDNIFEWHFVVQGAADTEFEGGLYHGRILLPPEYPFKPPSFLMLSPNGRFETGVKVCLSISSHHPEHWQPSWSVRTALVALIAFMQTPGNGAIGSLDYSKEERKELARKSRTQPPLFGNAERQALTNAAHARMLEREAAVAAKAPQPDAAAAAPTEAAAAVGTDPAQAPGAAAAPGPAAATAVGPAAVDAAAESGPAAAAVTSAPAWSEQPQPQPQSRGLASPDSGVQAMAAIRQRRVAATFAAAAAVACAPAAPAAQPAAGAFDRQTDSRPAMRPAAQQSAAPALVLTAGGHAVQQRQQAAVAPSWEEMCLTVLAAAIVMAIAALLIRKVVGFSGYEATSQSSFM